MVWKSDVVAIFEGIHGNELVPGLFDAGQSEVLKKFQTASFEQKSNFLKQLKEIDDAYPDGGIIGYLQNAKKLLENSRKGVNPLEGWKPSVPEGQMFELGTPEYDTMEKHGMEELGFMGFVLVAGGLGERLGYSGIKIGLPTEMTTETCYIQYYIEYILAVQKRFAPEGCKLPLCVMTSNDTNAKTVELLTKNKYFGMSKDQITLVQQGQGVPALVDNDAQMVINEESMLVVTKPHGHGDVHALLYNHGVTESWIKNGIKWLVLFQDTNGLAFHTLPLMLGVSTKLGLIMNSLAVPRKAKQAIGGIAKLTNTKTRKEKTINVEYNQLDPLLRATGYRDGDVNDKKTGFSPFPGNINQLLFRLEAYAKALEKTKGLMPEFVNPKYKDDGKTVFKKPTRLECMMQDFPTVLDGEETKQVGFTSVAAGLCFSPVKNATEDGVKLQEKGTHPGTAASGEADQYTAIRRMMRAVGCDVDDAYPEKFAGIKVCAGPAIVLKPSFVLCPGDYKRKFPTPDKVKISPNSTLVVRGSGVVIKSLDLDGCLVIDEPKGKELVIEDLEVKNEGWVREPEPDSNNEVIKMRGYSIKRKADKRLGSGDCVIL